MMTKTFYGDLIGDRSLLASVDDDRSRLLLPPPTFPCMCKDPILRNQVRVGIVVHGRCLCGGFSTRVVTG